MDKNKFLLLALLSMALAMATTSAFANTAAAGNEQTNLNFIGAESYGGILSAEIVVSLNTAEDKALGDAIVAYTPQSNSPLSQTASSLPGSQNFAADKLSDHGSNGGNYHAGKFSTFTVTTGMLISASA